MLRPRSICRKSSGSSESSINWRLSLRCSTHQDRDRRNPSEPLYWSSWIHFVVKDDPVVSGSIRGRRNALPVHLNFEGRRTMLSRSKLRMTIGPTSTAHTSRFPTLEASQGQPGAGDRSSDPAAQIGRTLYIQYGSIHKYNSRSRQGRIDVESEIDLNGVELKSSPTISSKSVN